MAMIDYGAVVFKNGKQINNTLFMDMEDAVGWVDYPRMRYEDCDCVRLRRSACDECQRAVRKHYSHPDLGEWDYVVGDCRGVKLEHIPDKLDENFFAYVGDEDLTFCFYKTYFCVAENKKVVYWQDGGNWFSLRQEYLTPEDRFWADGVKVHVKRLGNWVFHFSMVYKGDRYHVIYGYGIDPDMSEWNRVKVEYIGKKLAKKVDRLYERIKGRYEENG